MSQDPTYWYLNQRLLIDFCMQSIQMRVGYVGQTHPNQNTSSSRGCFSERKVSCSLSVRDVDVDVRGAAGKGVGRSRTSSCGVLVHGAKAGGCTGETRGS